MRLASKLVLILLLLLLTLVLASADAFYGSAKLSEGLHTNRWDDWSSRPTAPSPDKWFFIRLPVKKEPWGVTTTSMPPSIL